MTYLNESAAEGFAEFAGEVEPGRVGSISGLRSRSVSPRADCSRSLLSQISDSEPRTASARSADGDEERGRHLPGDHGRRSGTRFWPLSARRAQAVPPPHRRRRAHRRDAGAASGCAAERQLRRLRAALHAAAAAKLLKGLPKANVLVEPEARNTAPAIALAPRTCCREDPEGVMLVLPSDQHVADPWRFSATLAQAVDGRAAAGTSSRSASSRPGPRPATATSRSGDALAGRRPQGRGVRREAGRRDGRSSTSLRASTCGTRGCSSFAPT